MTSPSTIRKQFNQGLLTRIKKLTCTLASPNTCDAQHPKENPSKNAARKYSESNTSRAKTPQPDPAQNNQPKALPDESAKFCDYLRSQRNRSTTECHTGRPNVKAKAIPYAKVACARDSKTSGKAEDTLYSKYVSKSINPNVYPYRIGMENLNPNKTSNNTSNSKDLIALLNKEREEVGNLKTELKKTYLYSKKDKMELQQQLEELAKTNKALVKGQKALEQKYSELKLLPKKLEAVTIQARTLATGIVEALESAFAKDCCGEKELLNKLKATVLQRMEKVSAVEGGISFSPELCRLSMLQAKSNRLPNTQRPVEMEIKLNTEDIEAKYRTSDKKPKNSKSIDATKKINSNLHIGTDIFGPILPTIEASMIIQNNDENPSLLGTIANLNEELGNMSEGENIVPSPGNAVSAPKKSGKLPTNAMKELEELKARIMSRRKIASNNQ